VFKIGPKGGLTTLYTFCTTSDCPDGAGPLGLVLGADGNFYGTTGGGGASSYGTIFSIPKRRAYDHLQLLRPAQLRRRGSSLWTDTGRRRELLRDNGPGRGEQNWRVFQIVNRAVLEPLRRVIRTDFNGLGRYGSTRKGPPLEIKPPGVLTWIFRW